MRSDMLDGARPSAMALGCSACYCCMCAALVRVCLRAIAHTSCQFVTHTTSESVEMLEEIGKLTCRRVAKNVLMLSCKPTAVIRTCCNAGALRPANQSSPCSAGNVVFVYVASTSTQKLEYT